MREPLPWSLTWEVEGQLGADANICVSKITSPYLRLIECRWRHNRNNERGVAFEHDIVPGCHCLNSFQCENVVCIRSKTPTPSPRHYLITTSTFAAYNTGKRAPSKLALNQCSCGTSNLVHGRFMVLVQEKSGSSLMSLIPKCSCLIRMLFLLCHKSQALTATKSRGCGSRSATSWYHILGMIKVDINQSLICN